GSRNPKWTARKSRSLQTSELWLHESLREAIAAGLSSSHADGLLHQLTSIGTNPHTTGSPMRDVPVAALQGRVRKVHIKGPAGFRIAYFTHTQPNQGSGDSVTIACPFFLSNEPRS